MTQFLSACFEILAFTSVIVLVVLGLGVIASMMGIFNFAQGEFLLLGAYTTYAAGQAGLPLWCGMLAAPFLVGALGFVVERFAIRRLYALPVVAMLVTYAIGLSLRESVRLAIGGQYLSVPEPVQGSLAIGELQLSAWRLTVIAITLCVMAGCWLLITRTALGLKVRAALENPALARASGISTNAMYGGTFAFGSALAGLAGALLVPSFSLHADLGLGFLIQGFVAVMVGGVGGFAGPLAGAGLVGLLSASLPWFISSTTAEVLVFVVALVFVKFRPQGLFASRA